MMLMMLLRKLLWRSLSMRSSVASSWRSAATATALDRHPNGCDRPLALMRLRRRRGLRQRRSLLCLYLLLRSQLRRHRLRRHRLPRLRQSLFNRSLPNHHLCDHLS